MLLFVLPVFYAVPSAVLPAHFSEEHWRFGALGVIISHMTPLPLLGLGVAAVAAKAFDDIHGQQCIGWFCAFLAAIVALLSLVFIHDYLRVIAVVRPLFRYAASEAGTTVIVKQIVTVIILLLLARASLSGLVAREAGVPLVEDDSRSHI